MILSFTSFLTIFQSCRDRKRMINEKMCAKKWNLNMGQLGRERENISLLAKCISYWKKIIHHPSTNAPRADTFYYESIH